ncbi:MAG: hypothetical protein PHF63_12160 [Herbinix sp.]|nr:hypothetical protein [Herbinix sp.]
MKKKKLTGNQIRLLLCLVIVIIFALSYEYIYIKFEDLAEDYNSKTQTTNQLILQREQDITQQDTLKAKTKDISNQYEEIINAYPVKITKEDDLIFIEELKKELGINIPSANISVLDSTEFYTTILPIRDEEGNEIIISGDSSQTSDTTAVSTDSSSADLDSSTVSTDTASTSMDTAASTSGSTTTNTDEAAFSETDISGTTENSGTSSTGTTDGTTTDGTTTNKTTDGTATDTTGQQYMTGLQSSINITFQTTNKDFKKLVDYINKYPQKTSITNASLSFDSATGELMASMTINRYALSGTGKVYEEPYVGDISIGTDDLFGTTTKK